MLFPISQQKTGLVHFRILLGVCCCRMRRASVTSAQNLLRCFGSLPPHSFAVLRTSCGFLIVVTGRARSKKRGRRHPSFASLPIWLGYLEQEANCRANMELMPAFTRLPGPANAVPFWVPSSLSLPKTTTHRERYYIPRFRYMARSNTFYTLLCFEEV